MATGLFCADDSRTECLGMMELAADLSLCPAVRRGLFLATGACQTRGCGGERRLKCRTGLGLIDG
jgi:hypothetical protein